MLVATLDISSLNIGIIIKDAHTSINQLPLYYKCITNNFIFHLKNIYNKYKPELTIVGLSVYKDNILMSNGIFTKQFIHNNRNLFTPFIYINEYKTTINTSSLNFDLNINILSAILIFEKWQMLNILKVIY